LLYAVAVVSDTVKPMPDHTPTETAQAAAAALAHHTGREQHDVAIILGSGWDLPWDNMREGHSIPSSDLPGFHAPSVAGHRGVIHSFLHRGRRCLAVSGRTHLYEGHGVDAVVHPVRVAAAAGVQTLVVTNGCGTVHTGWDVGEVVLLDDHLNLTGTSPLVGPTFIDMTDAYSPALRERIRGALPNVRSGVYAQFRGPQYETPAEVRMARTCGADLVGMSTALEVIEARRNGLDVVGLSLVTNHAAGVRGGAALSHAEVLETGAGARARLTLVLEAVLDAI
jgi:purine-nucleoside phosphorylase